MGKKLIAQGEYRNDPRQLHYRPGERFDASDALYLFLMTDAPGVFVIAPEYTEEAKAVDAPPADKMVKSPRAKK